MLAAGADVPYVQAQVGHTDPKLTLEIYAMVLKRRDRANFAEAFDNLTRDAIPSIRQAKDAYQWAPAYRPPWHCGWHERKVNSMDRASCAGPCAVSW